MSVRKIFQVDSFTHEPFKGNPAGVMMVDESVSTQWMQQMAAEMNLSETAFLKPDGEDFMIRYYTPSKEVDLCGHATLASAHVVYELGLKQPHESILFKAKGGHLTIRKEGALIVMNFPAYPLERMAVPKNFKKIVGFEPVEVWSSLYNWVLAVAALPDEVVNAQPDFEALNANGLGELMITAPSQAASEDFVVRCFAPASGINEDPVTGSAHCALTPFWAGRLGKTELHSLQVSKRSGRLALKLLDNRVEIKGAAVMIFEASLKI